MSETLSLHGIAYCKECHEPNLISIPPQNIVLIGKYMLTFDASNPDALYGVFERIVDDIDEHTNVDAFRSFNYLIHKDVNLICKKCGSSQCENYFKSIQDSFFFYLQECEVRLFDSICNKVFSTPMSNGFVNPINGEQLSIILEHIPDEYREIREKLKKLNEIRWVLPIQGGMGGGGEFYYWILSNVKTEIFGIILQAAITFGLFRARRIIRKVGVRKLIKKYLNEDADDWQFVTIEDIHNNFPFSRKLRGNEMELVKKVIEKKSLEYSKEVVANLKPRQNWLQHWTRKQ